MNQPEIIINLWYVCFDMGFIYSLRALAYIGTGSDEEKLALLQKYAPVDYIIARIFPVPLQYSLQPDQPVYHTEAFLLMKSPIVLFEEAIRAIQKDLPVQTPYALLMGLKSAQSAKSVDIFKAPPNSVDIFKSLPEIGAIFSSITSKPLKNCII